MIFHKPQHVEPILYANENYVFETHKKTSEVKHTTNKRKNPNNEDQFVQNADI